jgi:hypothetical protein
MPMVLVLSPEGKTEPTQADEAATVVASDQVLRWDAAHQGGPRLLSFELGRNRLALPQHADEDRRLIGERLVELAESFDLAEPFQRIRDAIEEAQQAVR